MRFLDTLASRVVVFDGAMGTELHKRELSEAEWAGAAGCLEILNLSAPWAVQAVHRSYLEAGCDVVETNTFGANAVVLGEYGLAGRSAEINEAAARLARAEAVSAARDGRPRYVAGSIGPGTKLASIGQIDYDTLYDSYCEQVRALLRGGVDLFILETCQDPLQIKAGLHAVLDSCGQTAAAPPVMVSFTIETSGTLLVGSELEAVYTILEPFPLCALGLNCATGPEDMRPYVKQLAAMSRFPLIVQPNAGMPCHENGGIVYPLTPIEYERSMREFIRDHGVRIAGGCCGTTPEHIRVLAEALERFSPNEAKASDAGPAGRSARWRPAVASLYSAVALHQDPSPFFVGERTNTNGSRKFRERLLADDWDGLVEMAGEQGAAHALDLCVAYAGRDERADMGEALSRIVRGVDKPVFIDTTETAVMEAALKINGGRAVLNSINLEDGEAKADAVCRLARRFGAALIALTIDEEGMARSAEKKLAVARRIFAIAVGRHGLRPQDLIFDPLTFTLGSGDAELKTAGLETLTGLRLIKAKLPGVLTILGVSNISFGLKPASREILNSVFLAEAVKAGLDLAIVNVAAIVPLDRIGEEDAQAALNLINNRPAQTNGDALFEFIHRFEDRSDRIAAEGGEGLDPQERLRRAVLRGSKAGLERILAHILQERAALDIINGLLIPAMRDVGDLFGAGKMQLPFVLQSAEVMKAAVGLLEPHIEKSGQRAAKKLVLATVRGDVHDIGKNLVDIILSNNGYEVHNLGIKCEIETMIAKALETKADAIGMSGLLVKSTVVMKENLEEMRRRGMKLPVLLGGAALTPRFVYRECAAAYDGPVLYCADAFQGLAAMEHLKNDRLGELCEIERQRWSRAPARPSARETDPADENLPDAVEVPRPPFWGSRVVTDIGLPEVYAYLTEEVLFRGRWGYRRGGLTAEEYSALIETRVRPEFEALKKRCRESGLLVPAVVYGYFPCAAEGDELVLFAPLRAAEPGGEAAGLRGAGEEPWNLMDNRMSELARFAFPRRRSAPRRCIADYFLPRAGGRFDVIALQAVTMGQQAQDHAAGLYRGGDYKDYLLFHGLAVECAEALAEYWHALVRRELGIAADDGAGMADFVVQKYRGSRYSFGYPACPRLEDNRLLLELIGAQRIGIEVTSGEQMVPEQSTSAFIAHHPAAKYFAID